MAAPQSHRESFEKEETPYTSRAHSYVDDPEKQEQHLHHQQQDQSDTLRKYSTDGSPLEISSSHLSVPASPYIPDGGFTAWFQVTSGFFLFFNSWGLINAFGVFQSYYKSTLIPYETESNLSWIGSIEAFLLCCCTIFAGPAFDRGYGRTLVIAGTLMVVFGMMMTSLCTTYWQLMLAQGLCMGIGHGGLFIVSIAIVPSYFSTKRSFAIGLAASGSSLGGVIYTIVFHRLIDVHHLSFGWATRILGFMALGTLVIPCVCIKQRAIPAAPRKNIIDFSGFKELPFSLFSLASFVGFIGLYIPFFYISTFSSTKAGLDDIMAFYMLPILSAGSVAGRILPGFAADYLGPLNMLSFCTVVAGILGFCWIAIPAHASVGGLLVWSLLYGCFSGAFVIPFVGGRLGMNTFCAALGLLIGTPIAGVILGDNNAWTGLQAFCGATLLAGGALVMVTRWSRAGAGLARRA
ncbi:MFS-type transporter dbaD [Fulvia fulva]|uniref:MFS-type transporter dbaD n=1 Tax=Passalora fulva TaxID=5499 RepID=A0A9Q8PLV3_PASFU|nr:MFS-type transporter dbaD [Fulvia fulva]KAK4608983.1 MFS-type transporter dbaD [Fulvia fulva]KAK4609650.1 MFS-type transporter dbaD [Fulvia fulva]UJO24921.1 MFS-type transporter dbaD [Fulvia fulva]WPV22565.1 MFS-type transporter dbaD [Fulvia fulva]WPV37781.1 MFS-type transporter dbaD [Fulvia fulva]